MSVYSIVLFFHVCGAISIFVGMGTLLLGAAAMRRAKGAEQVQVIAKTLMETRVVRPEPLSLVDLLVVGGVLLVVATGLYLALTTWGLRTAWIEVALVSLVLAAPVGPFVINPRLRAIATAIERSPDSALSDSLRLRVHDPILGVALQVLTTWLLGIVFLMTNKPSLAGSITAMTVSLVVGLASGSPFVAFRKRQDQN